MYTHILVDYDVFSGNFDTSGLTGLRVVDGDPFNGPRPIPPGTASGQDLVRRPHRGIQEKPERYATIAVIGRNGGFHSTRNSSSWDATGNTGGGAPKQEPGVAWGDFNANFLLQSVSESRQEKSQVLTTFGPSYVFFFGENPRIKSFSAILPNTADFQWVVEWWTNYAELLRGTQLTNNRARAYISYDDVVCEGYIMAADVSMNSNDRGTASLSFSLFLTNEQYLVTPGKNTPDWEVGTDLTGVEGLANYTGTGLQSEEVRLRNIAALQKAGGPGLVEQIRAALGILSDPVGAAFDLLPMREISDFLLGKNLVIPAGFLGSERMTSVTNLSQAAISALRLTGVDPGVAVYTPSGGLGYIVKVPKTFYEGNWDEYPLWNGLRDADAATVAAASAPQTPDSYLTAAAMRAMAELGVTELQNNTGTGTSEVLRVLGRTTYGILTIASGALTQTLSASREAATQAERAAALTTGEAA